jgi:hypothetical protein
MESSGMWYNIYECMRKRHLDVRLSNPARTRAIASAKIKTDKLDAEKKVEAYNKIIKNEFISVEQISSIDEGKVRYNMFGNAYNETREHGGINGLTLSEMFLRTFNRSHTRTDTSCGYLKMSPICVSTTININISQLPARVELDDTISDVEDIRLLNIIWYNCLKI